MQSIPIRLTLALSAFALPGVSMASDTLDVLKTDLRADGRKIEVVRMRSGKTRFEVCGGDWCQGVITTRTDSSKAQQAWNAAFLMFYYFDANDEYQARRADHAARLIDPFRKKCIRQGSDERAVAACALKALSDRHGFRYVRVQYDAGSRCESMFMTQAPYFSGVGRCSPHRG